MATLPPCPRPDWSALPNLGRNIPAFLFIPACLPGTQTSSGCPADKSFYTIAVPWAQFLGGWEAPGGNRYWASPRFHANLQDPKVMGLLRLMAARSKDYFLARAADTTAIRNLKLSQVLGKPVPSKATASIRFVNGHAQTIITPGVPDVFAATYGYMTVEVKPDPNETVGAFIKRGGYLLHVDGDQSMRKGMRLQGYGGEKWWGGDVKQAELWADYNADAQQLGYTIRLVYKNAWKKTVDNVDRWLRANAVKLCAELSSPKAIAGTAAMAAFPWAAPYLAAYGAALSACGLAQAPAAPKCIPQEALPGAYLPPMGGGVVIQSPKGGTMWGTAAGQAAASMTATSLAPVTNTVTPGGAPPAIASPYPVGTIAWYDTSAPGYRVAVPEPGPGTTHRPVIAGALAKLPATGIRLVDKGQWERATLPWLRRGSTKIGMMIGGIAVASAATVFASRH